MDLAIRMAYEEMVSDMSFEDCFNEYVAFRKEIKKPMTDLAKRLALKKLEKFSKDKEVQKIILIRSIDNNWQGLFGLPKEEKSEDIFPM